MDQIEIPDLTTVDPAIAANRYRERMLELTEQAVLKDAKITELFGVCRALMNRVTELENAANAPTADKHTEMPAVQHRVRPPFVTTDQGEPPVGIG